MSPSRKRQRGFTIVEMLAALAIASLMIVGVTAMIDTSLADAKGQQAAAWQAQMTQAAAQLITQNQSALASAATPTVPVVVPLAGGGYQLARYLPPGVSGKNAYGQTPCLLVYGIDATTVQGLLVTEGGTTIGDVQLGYIAANAGAGGGSIPRTNNAAGAAFGAYGAWSIATPNPSRKSCSGNATGFGHLVNQVFPANAQAQNGDFLYRVSVPGNPALNTMQVPVTLAQQQDYAACTSATGSIAADASDHVVTCSGGMWKPITSLHWRDPVASAAALGSLPNPLPGDVAVTLATGRAYTFNGTAWQALAVNEAGYLDLGNGQAVGAPCAQDEANTTPVTTDASGRVLSCRDGTWQTQAEIEPVTNQTGCTILMASPNATDYAGCGGVPSGAWSSGPFTYNGANGTYSYYYYVPVTMAKPGIIAVTTWGHLNDGVSTGKRGAQAQLSQAVDVMNDALSASYGHTEAQSPTLIDDSGGITTSLTQAVKPGTYRVRIVTSWATYAVITTPWTSSLLGQQNQAIPNTPVVHGWTINTYY
ncbi:shufflon system plasmid conjugative transfer pilus tip adhesin PilV [Burkholderia cenocepacia]|uniref:shufflon system plasmid conjugative transfer pilus tip adhesin PilV n=1 Tax=Burkholderia cenocepacia TaxID=95486 RepID=UPI001CF4CFB1|nr:shufflon system plasmid conjugative transfer pilus tip adhesin PilV [Burkholderia cenocepacia]MCA7922197.1 shufflon system plasmid conjugative transfer pilus tip adhesin PilV [Burkholderia cenocepacia]